MRRLLPPLGAALLLSSCLSGPSHVGAASPREGTPITLGVKHTFHSTVLGEERGFLVYLPPGYDTSSERYPVLYLLDGDAYFHHATGVVRFLAESHRIPRMIVVGVSNTDRTRDFTPPVLEGFRRPGDTSQRTVAELRPTAGGAERFLRFLEEELAPRIESRYRTQPYRILVGHSLGGLFAVHTLMNHPRSFHAYIAISPSLWWNGSELVSGAVRSLERLPPQERFLYMSMGDEWDDMLEPIQRLARTLEQARPERLVWHYSFLANDHHGSTPLRTLYDGLEALFEDWRISEPLMRAGDLEKVEANYVRVTKRLGYELHPPEELLSRMGYQLLESGRVDAAITVFRRNVELHGDSPIVHDGLGEALEAAGQLDAALECYTRAIQRGIQTDRVHPIFQQHLERVLRKLASPQKEEGARGPEVTAPSP
jgi:uncharacterized protein